MNHSFNTHLSLSSIHLLLPPFHSRSLPRTRSHPSSYTLSSPAPSKDVLRFDYHSSRQRMKDSYCLEKSEVHLSLFRSHSLTHSLSPPSPLLFQSSLSFPISYSVTYTLHQQHLLMDVIHDRYVEKDWVKYRCVVNLSLAPFPPSPSLICMNGSYIDLSDSLLPSAVIIRITFFGHTHSWWRQHSSSPSWQLTRLTPWHTLARALITQSHLLFICSLSYVTWLTHSYTHGLFDEFALTRAIPSYCYPHILLCFSRVLTSLSSLSLPFLLYLTLLPLSHFLSLSKSPIECCGRLIQVRLSDECPCECVSVVERESG